MYIKKLKSWPYWPVVVIGCLLFLAIGFFKKVKGLGEKAGSMINKTVDSNTLQTGYPGGVMSKEMALQRVAELQEIANNLMKAIFNWYSIGPVYFYRANEDEDLIISELNKVKYAVEAALVSDYYADVNRLHGDGQRGLSLANDVRKYLSATQLSKISSVVLNNLK